MSHLLITSGPTRAYLDPVRFLTNGSSGRMGSALAEAALQQGHRVTLVSGPVELQYPAAAQVIRVVSTEEMLAACRRIFPECDGLIAVAAACDYRPVQVAESKIKKSGEPLVLHLVETPDIVATLAAEKAEQWLVGFALETEDHRFKALTKLQRKNCDLIVSNCPQAIDSTENDVEVIDRLGEVLAKLAGSKQEVARGILAIIQQRLIGDPKSEIGNRQSEI